MSLIVVALVCGLVSAGITAAVRRYALRNNVLDHPNERSSHVVPVPRGGGLAITIATLAAVAALYGMGRIEGDLATALVFGGALVAWIGWRDDHASIPAKVRAIVHFAAAGWALYWLGGLPALRMGVQSFHPGWMGTLLAAIGIVWMLNLYNFMDGIDGIAGAEGASVAGMGAFISLLLGATEIGLVSAALAGACAGFLVWNWAPARIFMGDVGSGFVGYVLAVVAIASEGRGGVALLVWGLLLATFIFDATVTLVRRVVRGERWSVAHRRHAYQRAVSSGMTHRRVTMTCLALNAPIFAVAAWVAIRPSLLSVGFLICALLLTTAYLWVEVRMPMYDGKKELAAGR